MAMSDILLAKDVDVKSLSFGQANKMSTAGKMVGLFHKGKPLFLQTPEMPAPFGVNSFSPMDDKSAPTKLSLDLSFKGKDHRPALQVYMNLLSEIDELILNAAEENSILWFDKQLTREYLKEAYTPLIKYAKDKETKQPTDKYPPTVRFNVPKYQGEIGCNIFNNKNQKVELDDIEVKGGTVTAIVQCTGVWAINKKFGCSWRIKQMKVNPPQNFQGPAFLNAPDEKIKQDEDDTDDYPEGVVVPQSDDEDSI